MNGNVFIVDVSEVLDEIQENTIEMQHDTDLKMHSNQELIMNIFGVSR